MYGTKQYLKKYCGWTNYSGKVISHITIESEMDYRGSKSDIYISVKEQRADGTGYLKKKVSKVCSSGLEKGTTIIKRFRIIIIV